MTSRDQFGPSCRLDYVDAKPKTPILALLLALGACSQGTDDNSFATFGEGDEMEPGEGGEMETGDDGWNPQADLPDDPSGDGDGDGDGGDDGSGDTQGDGGDGGDGDGDEQTPWDCSNFVDEADMLAWVNEWRQYYVPHDRYSTILGYHKNTTFPLSFDWDEGLAAQAQEQAEAMAAGQTPPGAMGDRLWVSGGNTGQWRISFDEVPSDWVEIPWTFGDYPFPLHKSHPAARKGLFYHDFGGQGPVIRNIGIGAALVDGPDCRVWWSLQFSE